MRDLNYDFKQICRHNRDGSYATQVDRQNILDLVADQLHEMGVRGLRAHGFKPKHVEKLVARWLAEHLAPGTIKNRMSHLRWLAQKIGKENIVARTNAEYGIAERVYVTNVDKAKDLDGQQLEQIRCPYTRMSLRLEDAFGLRRERRSRSSRPRPIAVTCWCSSPRGTRAGARSSFPSVPPISGSCSKRRRP